MRVPMTALAIFGLLFTPAAAQISNWKLYVANEGTNDISVFDQQGTFQYSVPLPTSLSPRQVQISPNGRLYVAAFNTGIVEYDSQDRFLSTFGDLSSAHGLAVGADARIYLTGCGKMAV